MTDKKRLEKLDALEDMTKRIGGCFGDADKIFAGHPSDEEKAKEFRKVAFRNEITLVEVQNIVSGYLYRTNFFEKHCKEQTEKATKFFAKKLQ